MRRIFTPIVALAILTAAPAVADEPQDDADVEAAEQQADADEPVDEEKLADDTDEGDLEEVDTIGDDEQPQLADSPDIHDGQAGTDHPLLAVAPRIGVTAPQPFGDLNSWPVFGLDIGVILPFDVGPMERPMQLGVDVGYTRPGADGEGHHPMLGDEGADYQWELTQQMLTLQLTAMWRFMAPTSQLSAHGLIGPRIYLMESVMEASGNDGADFGENRETNTEYGIVFGGGVEYQLGPGSLFGSLLVGGSPLDQRITGEANTAAFNLDVGYRLFF